MPYLTLRYWCWRRRVQLGEELKATASRADTMNGVVAALPSAEDTLRMTAYNWQDVQDLQEVRLCITFCAW